MKLYLVSSSGRTKGCSSSDSDSRVLLAIVSSVEAAKGLVERCLCEATWEPFDVDVVDKCYDDWFKQKPPSSPDDEGHDLRT